MSIKPNFSIDQLSSPFLRFTNMEAQGGLLLIITSAIALIWANSAWGATYEALWHTHLSLQISDFKIDQPLHVWINDGLMALFFFYVGLEIKHEVKVGELSSTSNALLPFLAALGGMIVPGILFYLLNQGQAGSNGWGIPMATDIAFSLGILMLLGDRVPNSMKIFLTAFAIVDDIGAILVIAIFYAETVVWSMLLLALGMLGILFILKQFNLRHASVYLLFGVIVWYLVLQSGIHPTVAGITVALLIPTNNRIRMRTFALETQTSVIDFMQAKANASKQFLAKAQLQAIGEIKDYVDDVQPPLQKLEHRLHPYVTFFIMPVFAFANAGVVFNTAEGPLMQPLSWSIVGGLLIGKVTGIVLFSWIGVRLGWAILPQRTSWLQMVGLGFLGGIGFTMALFIANLAFTDSPELLTGAKTGILFGSLLAAVLGFTILWWTLRDTAPSS